MPHPVSPVEISASPSIVALDHDDAAAAGIALSTVAGTVAANYQTCHENAEQLRALQEWVTGTMAAAKQ